MPFSVRIGYDLGKKIWSNYRKGNINEFYLNIKRKKNILDIVFGQEKMPFVHKRYQFSTSGYYIKAGYAYNFYDNWGNMRNEITLGLRFGWARFAYNHITIKRIPLNPSFEETQLSLPVGYDPVFARWIEVTSSVKTEIFKGLFLELCIAGKYLLNSSTLQNFSTVYIPGFYTTNVSGFGFGIGYGISYLIF